KRYSPSSANSAMSTNAATCGKTLPPRLTAPTVRRTWTSNRGCSSNGFSGGTSARSSFRRSRLRLRAGVSSLGIESPLSCPHFQRWQKPPSHPTLRGGLADLPGQDYDVPPRCGEYGSAERQTDSERDHDERRAWGSRGAAPEGAPEGLQRRGRRIIWAACRGPFRHQTQEQPSIVWLTQSQRARGARTGTCWERSGWNPGSASGKYLLIESPLSRRDAAPRAAQPPGWHPLHLQPIGANSKASNLTTTGLLFE